MRHQKTTKHLDRDRDNRRALVRSLASSLILYEKIKTTEAKAKYLKPIVEKMVTRAKKNTLHNYRELRKELPTGKTAKKLIEVIGPKYQDRKGGYLRIVKLEPRQGDGAKMAVIEFV